MGSSATAHLAYGYDVGGEETPARFVGVPDTEYDEPGTPEWWVDDDCGDEGDEYVDQFARRLIDIYKIETRNDWDFTGPVESRLGIEFITHGSISDGQTAYLMVAKGTEQRVDWGDVKAITLTVPDGADERLRAAAEALGLDTEGEGPRWLLVASYG